MDGGGLSGACKGGDIACSPGLNLAEVFWLACAGLALDAAFGEPRRVHPLVAFGRIADWIESRLNRTAAGGAVERRLPGVFALLAAVGLPVSAVAAAAYAPSLGP